jgi:hypothetical protein
MTMLKTSKANWILGVVALVAFLALIPAQSRAANMTYGNWEMDGFLRNNTGVWMESWDYAPNQDPLATCRNWFRLNLNGKISDSLKLKIETLAIYEPEYDREEGAGIKANYYNQFDFRECRLDWKIGNGHNLRIGKQIVNWGESLSARVGDVINPIDGRFDLGFTNLEDTRMPIWMIRGMHQFYSIGTSIDWIFSPYMEVDRYRVSRTLAWGPLKMDANGENWNGVGQSKFTPYPEWRFFGANGKQYSANQILGIPAYGLPNYVAWPAVNTSYTYNSEDNTYSVPWLNFPVLNFNEYPGSKLSDSRYGFKTSSTVFGAQTGVYFWRHHQDQGIDSTPPLEKTKGVGGAPDTYTYEYTRQNIFGFYANKNFDFGVLRTDMAYKPNLRFQTMREDLHPNLVTECDQLKVQLGYNKDFMIRALNPDQTFGLIAEYVGTYILNGDTDGAMFAFPWYTKLSRDDHAFMASFGTNYNFGMYAPDLTVLFNPRNSQGLVMPSISYNPDWMNRKWSFKLAYTALFGEGNFQYPYAIAKEKDLVVLTTQFSFP